jgi:hypothetical protein
MVNNKCACSECGEKSFEEIELELAEDLNSEISGLSLLL